MRAVIQRVLSAAVCVGLDTVGSIDKGFLVLLGVEQGDDNAECDALAQKIARLRIFCDEQDKMNLSLADVGGAVLVISNFTLCADCKKGRRPNFENAARPQEANPLYERFCQQLGQDGSIKVEKGLFGADMRVSIVNDGPVTIIIDSKEISK